MYRYVFPTVLLSLAVFAYAQDGGGIESALQRASTATPAEMQAFAESSLETVKENAKAVSRMTEQARQKGEFEIQRCLVPKKSSSQALVQVTELAGGNLSASLTAGGEAGTAKARHEYRKIAVSVGKSESIRAEAENCEDDGGSGKVKDSVTVAGGTGSDADTIDSDTILEIDVLMDMPSVSVFEP